MKSEIRSGALLNYANLLLRIGVDFFMVPLLLLCLGKSEFAIYTLAGVVVARLALCDFGLTASATRFLSEYRARGDAEGEAHFLGNLLALFSLGGALVLVLGAAFYPFLGDVFSRFTPGEMKIFRVLYIMTVLNTALMFPARSLGGISASRQRFRVPGIIAAVASVINIAGTFALLMLGFRSVALTALAIATGVFSLLCHAIYCFGVLRARIRWRGWDMPLLRGLFAFSLWVFLSQLINVMNAGTGNFLVALTQDTEQVTLYTNKMNQDRPESAAQERTNKSMAYIMPLMSLWIGFTIPAALTVYWIAQYVVSMGTEYISGLMLKKDYEKARLEAIEMEKRAKEEEKQRKEEARLARARRLEEEKLNRKNRPEPEVEPDQVGVNREDSRVGIRTYARGRAYIPDRYETVPYWDPNIEIHAKAEIAWAERRERDAKRQAKKDAREARKEAREAKKAERRGETVQQPEQPKKAAAPKKNKGGK
ncbi:MAG: YidC/Oxa1 family membrane protein insertase [Akkermansia sp.]|nr:YidC/Oxa1 family membrane protein insertase [Akkermansia sp.]